MTTDIPEEEVSGDDVYLLQERYLELTRVILPAEAKRRGWILQEDHCFMRVILDHLFSDCWYQHLDRRLKAYKQLNEQQLRTAITMAEAILKEGQPLLKEMNRRSLLWRGKVISRRR